MKNLKFGDKFISLVSQTPCFTVSPLFGFNDDIVIVWRCQYFPQHASHHRRFQFCSDSVFVAFMSMWPWVSLTPHTLPPSWKVTIRSSSSYISYISSSYMYCICIFVRHSKYRQDQKCNLTPNPKSLSYSYDLTVIATTLFYFLTLTWVISKRNLRGFNFFCQYQYQFCPWIYS